MNITSVNLEIINLLNARCLVTMATFPWCTTPRMEKKQTCLTALSVSDRTRHLILVLFFVVAKQLQEMFAEV